jgi:hypothetical protein
MGRRWMAREKKGVDWDWYCRSGPKVEWVTLAILPHSPRHFKNNFFSLQLLHILMSIYREREREKLGYFGICAFSFICKLDGRQIKQGSWGGWRRETMKWNFTLKLGVCVQHTNTLQWTSTIGELIYCERGRARVNKIFKITLTPSPKIY